jgi:hypothetical protein
MNGRSQASNPGITKITKIQKVQKKYKDFEPKSVIDRYDKMI